MCSALGLRAVGTRAVLLARLQAHEPSSHEEEKEEETDRPSPSSPSSSDLEALSYRELQAMCSALGLRAVGTRGELLARLQGQENDTTTGGNNRPAAAAGAQTHGIRGLCLGASQDPDDDASIQTRNGHHSRMYSPLAAIRADVQLFASLLKEHFRGDAKTFVGHEGAEWMTRNRFLGLLERELLQAKPSANPRPRPEYYALYVLYYAGHGTNAGAGRREPDGRFAVERHEEVSVDDILAKWAVSAPYKEGGSRLLIVADSCFSGAMVDRIRFLCTRPGQNSTREAKAARTVAIQAACGHDEMAYDGIFTELYVEEIRTTRRVLDRHLLFQTTRFPAHIYEQHPEYFCPWGEVEIGTGPRNKTFPLFKV